LRYKVFRGEKPEPVGTGRMDTMAVIG